MQRARLRRHPHGLEVTVSAASTAWASKSVRPSGTPSTLGVVGDASADRLNAVFSPPPLCWALGRAGPTSAVGVPPGPWLGMSLEAPVEQLTFTTAATSRSTAGSWCVSTTRGTPACCTTSPHRCSCCAPRRPRPRPSSATARRCRFAAGLPPRRPHRTSPRGGAAHLLRVGCAVCSRRRGDDRRPTRRTRRGDGRAGGRRHQVAGPARLDRVAAPRRPTGAALVEGVGPRGPARRRVRHRPGRPGR